MSDILKGQRFKLITLGRGLIALTACLCVTAPIQAATTDVQYYRYIDENGVPVIRNYIPPRYTQKGYEVVTSTGRVIRVVKPAPSASEKKRLKTEAEMAKLDAELHRRFSNADEIIGAKDRKLDRIDGSIKILKGNIAGIDTRIHQKRMEAADAERAGRNVPKIILERLESLKVKRESTMTRIKLREVERKTMVEKYDEAIERFQKISDAKKRRSRF